MTTYLAAIGVILAILLFGIVVQRFYQLFARRHPELGPFRDAGKGCGSCSAGSGCGGGSCDNPR
jgi:hypothetical protein